MIYQFNVGMSGVLSLTSDDDDTDPIDNDFFLLTGLSSGPNDDPLGFSPEATEVFNGVDGEIVFTSGSFGLIPAGNYYLSVDAFLGTGAGLGEGAFNFDLTFAEFVPPTPPPAISAMFGGSYSTTLAEDQILFFELDYTSGSPSIDTFGSDFDTELALFAADGTLIFTNDDAGGGLQSEISFIDGLDPAGTYYIAVGGFNTLFDDGFSAVPSSTIGSGGGNLVLNGLSVPEPASLGLLSIAGLGLVRRRRA